jgi:hypothetical protein
MKWFKHHSDASDDEFIAGLEEEFGLEGYARWWKLLEAIALQMDETDRCSVEYPIQKWLRILKAKRKKLDSFLVYSENKLKINTKQTGNILEIEVPKLVEIRDNYSKNLQATSKKLASKEVEVRSKNKNKEKEYRRFTPPTHDEVKEYCEGRGNNVDVGKFIDFYESKGWMVGKNKMKDWRAAVRNWTRGEEQKPQSRYAHLARE